MVKFVTWLRLISLSVILLLFSCKTEKKGPVLKMDLSQQVYSNRLGPSKEKPSTIQELESILNSVEKLKTDYSTLSVAVAMHDVNNDWSQALIQGLENKLSDMGLPVSIITDGEFDIEKQLADYDNIIRLKPDILITLPLDADKCSKKLKEIADLGIELVFIDAVPNGFKIGEYGGWAVGDGFRMGELSAKALTESLENESQVVLLSWKNKMFTVDERTAGAKEHLKTSNKVSELIEVSFSEFHEIPSIIDSLVAVHPEIVGMWTVWDTPAFEAITAFEKQKKKIKVATCDLSTDAAKKMAKTEYIVALGVDQPFQQGEAVALIAQATLEKISIPSYFVLPAQVVTRSNLSSSWKNIFHKPLPSEITELLK